MENKPEWHYWNSMTEEQIKIAKENFHEVSKR